MIEKDNIKDLFAKGLQDHHVQVDPALWTSISSSIGAGAAKTGLGLLSKILIGVGASASIAGVVYLSLDRENPTPKKQDAKTQQETVHSKEAEENTAAPQTNELDQQQNLHTRTPLPAVNYLIEEGGNATIQLQLSQAAPEHTTTILSNQASQTTSIPHSIPVSIPTQTQAVQTIVPAPESASQAPVKVVPNQFRVSLPNIFTPNNDGQNETLQIDWKQKTIEDFSIVVLNKENQVVFSSSNPHFDWDGSDLGSEKLARGAYIYFVAGVLDGQKWQQSSSLQIQY
jgi:gliding motility-associated-like protein